jgi:hypothetical protein
MSETPHCTLMGGCPASLHVPLVSKEHQRDVYASMTFSTKVMCSCSPEDVYASMTFSPKVMCSCSPSVLFVLLVHACTDVEEHLSCGVRFFRHSNVRLCSQVQTNEYVSLLVGTHFSKKLSTVSTSHRHSAWTR